jgi:hypothetical protein
MEISTIQNVATVRLEKGESFYFKPALLKGFSSYDWTFPPPHFFGSPIARLYHRAWILKEVRSQSETLDVKMYGSHPRGNFKQIHLVEGEKLCIGVRFLAGFSKEIKSIHTRIRFGPSSWLLREHFFSVFEGPGWVLLYCASSIEETKEIEFQPRRIVAFDAKKKFRPLSPQPQTIFSQVINLLFSHEVILQFQEPGEIWADHCSEDEDNPKSGFRSFIKHLLGFLRI